MRASRLLSILTTLQAKGQATAGQLADACEVSVRTIYRDIDALSAAGVPVYSERGADGGYRLLDGYRTRLNGFSRPEAEALFLAGLPEPAALLGLGAVMANAELKLLAALPSGLRQSAEAARARFHLDAPSWFEDLEHPTALQEVAGAVWRQTAILARYRSSTRDVERRLEPLGLVLKGGAWYLVARAEGQLRTYRVARMHEVRALDDGFEPPASFNLQGYWQESTDRFESNLYEVEGVIRVSPQGLERLVRLGRARARAAQASSEPDADGWRRVSFPMESIQEGAAAMLRLGPEAEALEPPELRAAVSEAARAMHAIYAGASTD